MRVYHSGRWWTAIGTARSGRPVWPVEEMLARRKFKPTVRDRIRNFYPNGKEEGTMTRGWFIKPISWRKAKRRHQHLEDFKGRPKACRLKGGKKIFYPALLGSLYCYLKGEQE